MFHALINAKHATMEYVQPVSLDMSQIQLVFVSFHVQSHAQPALTTSQQSAFPAMVMPALLMALVFSIPLAILILLAQTVVWTATI